MVATLRLSTDAAHGDGHPLVEAGDHLRGQTVRLAPEDQPDVTGEVDTPMIVSVRGNGAHTGEPGRPQLVHHGDGRRRP